MRTRAEIITEDEHRNDYAYTIRAMLEVLLDIRDLLAQDISSKK